jgi:hypothetical protein
MPINELISIFIYILPVLIALDKDKLKLALFLFIFLMCPIMLKIYTSGFEFLMFMQSIFWIASFIFLRYFGFHLK